MRGACRAMRVTYKDHPDDLATCASCRRARGDHGCRGRASRSENAPVKPQTSSVHLLGTCRMGNDPAKSVVDRYHRSHDIPNLFVCDGSSLVTSGRGQPTMTIQALAFRAAEHIANFARRNEYVAKDLSPRSPRPPRRTRDSDLRVYSSIDLNSGTWRAVAAWRESFPFLMPRTATGAAIARPSIARAAARLPGDRLRGCAGASAPRCPSAPSARTCGPRAGLPRSFRSSSVFFSCREQLGFLFLDVVLDVFAEHLDGRLEVLVAAGHAFDLRDQLLRRSRARPRPR